MLSRPLTPLLLLLAGATFSDAFMPTGLPASLMRRPLAFSTERRAAVRRQGASGVCAHLDPSHVSHVADFLQVTPGSIVHAGFNVSVHLPTPPRFWAHKGPPLLREYAGFQGQDALIISPVFQSQ